MAGDAFRPPFALHWERSLVAYRFLLEVPESLVDEANIVVGSVGDAQVVVVRNSHGLGFDDPYQDLTIAAHSLLVINAIYGWLESLGQSRPVMSLVLHSGQRLDLADYDRGRMIAAIRYDQPWVERTLPKIGEHYREILPPGDTRIEGIAPQPITHLAAVVEETHPIIAATKQLTYLSPVHVLVKVPDLDRAERFYVDFVGVHLLGRERLDVAGELQLVERDYHGPRALTLGTEADFSYLANEPLRITLQRVGRGARLPQDNPEVTAVRVDHDSFVRLRGDALMRGSVILQDSPEAFAVRDIYGLIWQFVDTADVPNPA
jgi:catechol 2,3-dioxygenase-like lactoylglutathione lyase family enzyme